MVEMTVNKPCYETLKDSYNYLNIILCRNELKVNANGKNRKNKKIEPFNNDSIYMSIIYLLLLFLNWIK